MTAIGFVLLVVGYVFVRGLGVSYWDAQFGRSNIFDKVGAPMSYVGFVLLVAGVAIRLWELMP